MPQPQPPGMPTLCVRQPWWQRLSHWLGNEGGDDDMYGQYHDRSSRAAVSPYGNSFVGGLGAVAGTLPKLGSVVPLDSAASRPSEPEQGLPKGAPPGERQSSRRNPRRGPLQKVSRPEGTFASSHGAPTEHFPAAPVQPPRSARSSYRSSHSHSKSVKDASLTKSASPHRPEASARGSVDGPPASPSQLPEVKSDAFQDNVWDLAAIIPNPQEVLKGKPVRSARTSKSREQAFLMDAHDAAGNPIDATPQRSARGRRSKKMHEGLPELIDRDFSKTTRVASAISTEAPVTPSTVTSRNTSAPASDVNSLKWSSGGCSVRQSLLSSERSGNSSARHSLPSAEKSPGVRRSLGDFPGASGTRRSVPFVEGSSGVRRSVNDMPPTRRSMLSVNEAPEVEDRSTLQDPEAWIAAAAARHSLRTGDPHHHAIPGQVSGAAEKAAANLADRYKDPQGKLKADQAAWRRHHEALVKRRSAGAIVSEPDDNMSFRPGRRVSDTEDKKEVLRSVPADTKPADTSEAKGQTQQAASRSSSKQLAERSGGPSTEAFTSGGSMSSASHSADDASVKRGGSGSGSGNISNSRRSVDRSDGQRSPVSQQRGNAAAEHPSAGMAGAVAGASAAGGSGTSDGAANVGENLGAANTVNSMAFASTDTEEQTARSGTPAPPSREQLQRKARSAKKRHTADADVFRSFHSESSAGNECHEDGHRQKPSTPGASGSQAVVMRRQKTMAATVGRTHSKTATSSRPGTMEDPMADEQIGSVAGEAQTSESRPSACHLHWQTQMYGKLPMGATEGEVDACVEMARKCNLQVGEVWNRYETFKIFDQGHSGKLSQQEFEKLVRHYCNLPADGHIPDHLLNRHYNTVDTDLDGKVSFEEFVVWSIEVDFAEEVMVPDPRERHLRQLAREHDFVLTDVERIKGIFDSFDIDKSGEIDEEEFRKALFVLLRAKNESDVSQKKLLRYWREADVDRSGEISFEEFLLWYYRCFVSENGHYW